MYANISRASVTGLKFNVKSITRCSVEVVHDSYSILSSGYGELHALLLNTHNI
jgi:hypothetical protein